MRSFSYNVFFIWFQFHFQFHPKILNWKQSSNLNLMNINENAKQLSQLLSKWVQLCFEILNTNKYRYFCLQQDSLIIMELISISGRMFGNRKVCKMFYFAECVWSKVIERIFLLQWICQSHLLSKFSNQRCQKRVSQWGSVWLYWAKTFCTHIPLSL